MGDDWLQRQAAVARERIESTPWGQLSPAGKILVDPVLAKITDPAEAILFKLLRDDGKVPHDWELGEHEGSTYLAVDCSADDLTPREAAWLRSRPWLP